MKGWYRSPAVIGAVIGSLLLFIGIQVKYIFDIKQGQQLVWRSEPYRELLICLNVPAEALYVDQETLERILDLRLQAYAQNGTTELRLALPLEECLRGARDRADGERLASRALGPAVQFPRRLVSPELYARELAGMKLGLSEAEVAARFRAGIREDSTELAWLDLAVRTCEQLVEDWQQNAGVAPLLRRNPALITTDLEPALRRLLLGPHPGVQAAAAEALLVLDVPPPELVPALQRARANPRLSARTAEKLKRLETQFKLDLGPGPKAGP